MVTRVHLGGINTEKFRVLTPTEAAAVTGTSDDSSPRGEIQMVQGEEQNEEEKKPKQHKLPYIQLLQGAMGSSYLSMWSLAICSRWVGITQSLFSMFIQI